MNSVRKKIFGLLLCTSLACVQTPAQAGIFSWAWRQVKTMLVQPVVRSTTYVARFAGQICGITRFINFLRSEPKRTTEKSAETGKKTKPQPAPEKPAAPPAPAGPPEPQPAPEEPAKQQVIIVNIFKSDDCRLGDTNLIARNKTVEKANPEPAPEKPAAPPAPAGPPEPQPAPAQEEPVAQQVGIFKSDGCSLGDTNLIARNKKVSLRRRGAHTVTIQQPIVITQFGGTKVGGVVVSKAQAGGDASCGYQVIKNLIGAILVASGAPADGLNWLHGIDHSFNLLHMPTAQNPNFGRWRNYVVCDRIKHNLRNMLMGVVSRPLRRTARYMATRENLDRYNPEVICARYQTVTANILNTAVDQFMADQDSPIVINRQWMKDRLLATLAGTEYLQDEETLNRYFNFAHLDKPVPLSLDSLKSPRIRQETGGNIDSGRMLYLYRQEAERTPAIANTPFYTIDAAEDIRGALRLENIDWQAPRIAFALGTMQRKEGDQHGRGTMGHWLGVLRTIHDGEITYTGMDSANNNDCFNNSPAFRAFVRELEGAEVANALMPRAPQPAQRPRQPRRR